jgi:AraC family L-rhamnose operon transcriptional activator RhaR/AraC family L-rhamnose operon regulatory protein RhaS
MEGYQSLFVLDPFFSSKKGYENFVHLPYQELMEMMLISETILNEFKVKRSGYKTIIKSKFLELAVKLSRSYFCHDPKKLTPRFRGLSKAITFIEKNYTKPIYNEDLANMASLSTRQFLRIFKECYKYSPVNYIIQLRLKHACNLLKTKDLSLKDIAYDCGFSDANYFSRLFSSHIGKSPSEYRKEISLQEQRR